jgi:hypothetical protein
MKVTLRLAGLVIIALGLAREYSPSLEAQRSRPSSQTYDRVCFYMDADYRGEELCANVGESQRNVGERYNDKISSIRISGRAEVTVFQDENFRGSSQTFRQDVPNLGGWNDKITSFQVAAVRSGGGYTGNEPRNGACFYMDADFRGENFCMNSGENNGNVGNRYNDKISSIRVFGRAQVIVYENDSFGGNSRTYSRDVSNLGEFNDRITSIRVTR